MPKGDGLTRPLKLSDDLAAIVGVEEASRAECIKLLWAYLKAKELQDPANKQYFTPDAKMAAVFGTEKIRGFGMAKYLTAHLTPIKELGFMKQEPRIAKQEPGFVKQEPGFVKQEPGFMKQEPGFVKQERELWSKRTLPATK